MGFGQPLVSASRWETLGAGTGVGATVNSGSANAKGSFSTLGQTSFRYDGLYLDISIDTGAARWRLDLAVNTGGADEIIAQDIILDGTGTLPAANVNLFIPIAVPPNATLKARAQCSSGGNILYCMVSGFQSTAKSIGGFSRFIACTDWGASTDAANSLTLNGTTLTSPTQVQLSTPERIAGLYFGCSGGGSAPNTGAKIIFDIMWGASGSEIVFLRRLISFGNGNFSLRFFIGPMPCDLPGGTRLSVRAQCSGADSNTIYPALYGLAK